MVKPGSVGTAAGREAAQPQASPRSQFISSVKIRGRIENDLADLQIELEVGLLSQGPQWVPIGLDRQIITSARERDRELELRSVGQDRWEVRVEGQGTHALQLGLRSPVEANPERKRLQFAIPLAPSTYLDVEIPRPVDEVRLESGESIGKMPAACGHGDSGQEASSRRGPGSASSGGKGGTPGRSRPPSSRPKGRSRSTPIRIGS